MPVYRILDEMPYEELMGWFSYLDRRPVDWRDDDRTFKYLQTQGYKGKPWEVFPSLNPIYRPITKLSDDKTVNIQSLKGSIFFHKMLSSKKGDHIDFSKIEGFGTD